MEVDPDGLEAAVLEEVERGGQHGRTIVAFAVGL
jgi:hypothetical protein